MLYINSNFHLGVNLPIDSRFVLSKEQMLNANPNIIPDVYFCVCSDDGQFYLYNKDNVGNAETGKYEKLASNSSDDTEIWKESTEYIVGKIVKYNGKKYQCITLHTSSSVFEDDGANWIELVETYALLTKAQHDYLIDNGLLEDKIYVKVDDTTSEDNLVDFDGITIKEFDVTVEYQASEYVIYDNVIYKANTTTTIGTFVESEWDSIGGSGESASNVIVMSKEEYEALAEEDRKEGYYYLVYDENGNLTVDSGSNAIKIKDYDSTVSYEVDECVIYNNKLYRAITTTSTGSFVESEWAVLGGDSSDVMNIIGDLNELPDDCDKTNIVNAIKQVFQSSNDAQNAYETAIIGKGGTVSKVSSVATKSEILDGIESISVGEDITPIHDAMTDLGYNTTDLTNLSVDKTAHIISKWFVLKSTTDNVDTILDVANTDTFTDWITDDEITDFGDYINPNYSATQLTVSEDVDSGMFVSEELAVHELYAIDEGEVS